MTALGCAGMVKGRTRMQTEKRTKAAGRMTAFKDRGAWYSPTVLNTRFEYNQYK